MRLYECHLCNESYSASGMKLIDDPNLDDKSVCRGCGDKGIRVGRWFYQFRAWLERSEQNVN